MRCSPLRPGGRHGKRLSRRLSAVLGVTACAALAGPLVLLASAAGAAQKSPAAASPAVALVSNPAALVNPFIGTANDGDTFPGADAPFGMVQWSPDTTSRVASGDYSYSDSAITGFSLDHMSGAGCGADGDIPILPTVGGVDTSATDSFSHANESASAGYYKVGLDNGVTTALTVTPRTGMAQFTFPATNQANLILKLNGSFNGDSATSFTVVSNHEVEGSATSSGFCGGSPPWTLHFDLKFNKPFTSSGTPNGAAYVTFDTTRQRTVLAKIGVSFVSTANAAGNLKHENPGWNFAATKAATQRGWNRLLGRVQVGGGTGAQRIVFYTALYHALLHPNVYSDDNGQYAGANGKVHRVDAGHSAFYTNFSGWDIYRSQAQLEALVAPTVASDTAESMVDVYSMTGALPKWMLNDGEANIMTGDSSDAIIADYFAFGARHFNTSAALADMVTEATKPNWVRPGLDYLNSPGYLPWDGTFCCGLTNSYGAVSDTLEFDTDDFAISALAAKLGKTKEHTAFVNRAQDWRNVIDPDSGMAQQRNANGTWVGGYDPTSSNGFTEGVGWQYTGMVPFNLAGLTAAKGGKAAMNAYLSTVLSGVQGATNGTQQADVGNEPSIELPWEPDYTGEPWLTQKVVREAQDQLWFNAPAGLGNGNDDLGTMSAWYVWSALGMYPETPGTASLALGSPMFTRALITLPSGKVLAINGNGAADNAPYVRSATWNGSAWNKAYAPANAIVKGGTLTYKLGTTPNKSWAASAAAAPPSYGGSIKVPRGPRVGEITASVSASLCIDDAGSSDNDGNPVQIWGCDRSGGQSWVLGADGTIRTLGKCLDVFGGGTANGTKVDLYTCTGGSNQRWRLTAAHQIVNPSSGLCLDDPNLSTTNGTQLDIWTCNGGANQKWTPRA
jgi:predicted alpha-1,2-mannosidase